MMSRIIRILVVAALLSGLAACGDSVSKDQTVWITIPATDTVAEGYAIGKIISANKQQVQVKVSKVVSDSSSKEVVAMRTGIATIPRVWAQQYKLGYERQQAISNADKTLKTLLTNNTGTAAKDLDKTIELARNQKLPATLATAQLLKVRQTYSDNQIPLATRINNTDRILKAIRSLAEEHKVYSPLVSKVNATLRYRKQGQLKAQVVKALGTTDSARVANQYAIFLNTAHAMVKQVRHDLDASAEQGIPALTLIDKLGAIGTAEDAYWRFVSEDGKRTVGVVISDVVEHQKAELVKKLIPALRDELRVKHNLDKVVNLDQAKAQSAAVLKEAATFEKSLKIRIFDAQGSEKQMLAQAKQRFEALKQGEDIAYHLALDSSLEPQYQREMLESYVANYPQGKFLPIVKQERGIIDTREKLLKAATEKKIGLLREQMQNRKSFHGVAEFTDKRHKFRLDINKFDKSNGQFTGRITWPTQQGAVSSIQGQLDNNDSSLSFREIQSIKQGKGLGKSTFEFNIGDGETVSGTHTYRALFLSDTRPAVLSINK